MHSRHNKTKRFLSVPSPHFLQALISNPFVCTATVTEHMLLALSHASKFKQFQSKRARLDEYDEEDIFDVSRNEKLLSGKSALF